MTSKCTSEQPAEKLERARLVGLKADSPRPNKGPVTAHLKVRPFKTSRYGAPQVCPLQNESMSSFELPRQPASLRVIPQP